MIARAIGPEGRGETAAALAAFALAPILIALGLPTEVRRQVASAQTVSPALVRTARDVTVASLLPAFALAVLLVETIFADFSTAGRALVFAGVSLAPLAISWSVDTGVLVATGRYRAVLVLRIMQPAFLVVAIPIGWMIRVVSVEFVLAASIFGTVLTAVAGLLLVKVSILGSRQHHLTLLRGSVRYAGSSIAEAASARVDQILVLPLIGAAQTGLYAVAVTLATLPLAVGQAHGAHVFRSAASTLDEDGRLSSNSLREISSLSLPMCLGLALGGPPLLVLLFGRDFAGSAIPLLVLLPGAYALTVGFVASLVLAATGRGVAMTIGQFAALASGIALLYLFAPAFGAIGAALASTLSCFVLLTCLMIALRTSPRSLLPTVSSVKNALAILFQRGADS